ncbi:MAG: ECF-type sigma factor [Verrucomicrobiota bacterium]
MAVANRWLGRYSRRVDDLTRILQAAQQGDPKAADELLPLVYSELRRLAAFKMADEASGHSLQPTALVHEAWLKLAGRENQQWNGRTHFFNAAAEAMRRILVDNARRKRAARHGGQMARADLQELDLPLPMPDDELLALDDALGRLNTFDARAAQLVKLCFFVGLTREQAAQELGMSLRSTERLWAFARAFLAREMEN